VQGRLIYQNALKIKVLGILYNDKLAFNSPEPRVTIENT
jgi:hypothetical protein